MMAAVTTRTYEAPPLDRGEVLRYMGCRKETPDIKSLLDDCLAELAGKLSYKVCFGSFDAETFSSSGGSALEKNLSGCREVVLFAATIGIGIDRLIVKYSRLAPSRALCFQAIGSERIESLCNAFNDDVRREQGGKGFLTRPRFSPGYGDFPLAAQKQIFDLLDCPRKIGLSLTESLLMSPSKSVTALIGLYASAPGEICPQTIAGEKGLQKDCGNCSKTDCDFRKE